MNSSSKINIWDFRLSSLKNNKIIAWYLTTSSNCLLEVHTLRDEGGLINTLDLSISFVIGPVSVSVPPLHFFLRTYLTTRSSSIVRPALQDQIGAVSLQERFRSFYRSSIFYIAKIVWKKCTGIENEDRRRPIAKARSSRY